MIEINSIFLFEDIFNCQKEQMLEKPISFSHRDWGRFLQKKDDGQGIGSDQATSPKVGDRNRCEDMGGLKREV